MAITRVTQRMITEHSLTGMQQGLSRLARLQEQLSTGRVLNRPSDSPADTVSAMRLRDSLSQTRQFQRNAEDGRAWLGEVDSALASATSQLNRARDLALRGASSGSTDAAAREALAAEVDQIREGVLKEANASYLGRPVFGGTTAGTAAYDASGAYVGDGGEVLRTVGDGVRVRVDAEGTAAFGPTGDSAFDHLTALSTALRAGDQAGISLGLDRLKTDLDRVNATRAEAGSRYNRVETAMATVADGELRLTSSLSEVENADLARTVVDLQLQEVAYQAALGATARVIQPSLMDFLR